MFTLFYPTDLPLAQLTGITFGLSVSGAVFLNTATNGLKAALPQIPVKELSQVVAGASSQVIKSLSPEQHALALDIIVASWNKTFMCVYVAAAASLVASIFFKVNIASPTTSFMYTSWSIPNCSRLFDTYNMVNLSYRTLKPTSTLLLVVYEFCGKGMLKIYQRHL